MIFIIALDGWCARVLAEICRRHGVTLPQVALQFPLRHPAVVSVVVGVENAGQAEQSRARYDAEIPDSLWDELESQTAKVTRS